MSYRVKEIFHSLQGEGLRSGRAAVFCRFSGCNLQCAFCDTDHQGTDGPGGGIYQSPEELGAAVLSRFPEQALRRGPAWVVLTGGEPALQIDEALIRVLKAQGLKLAVESNGSLPLPPGLDWITVSPKAGAGLALRHGQELKLVWPQAGLNLDELEQLDFDHYFLQPQAGPEQLAATAQAVEICLARPRWGLSLQLHKILGID